MADNVVLQPTPATPPSGTGIATAEVAFSGNTVQAGIGLMGKSAGAEGSRVLTLVDPATEGNQTTANTALATLVAGQQSDGLTNTELRATPVPVSGTVTANAGTNLNTSALALEAGGNLAAIAASASVLDDWDETNRAAVNLIAGQVGVQGGAGAVTALTQRMAIATDANDVDVSPLAGIFNGVTNVTTAGTQVALASSQAVSSVTIKAKVANTGLIYIGGASVSSADGFQLSPGDSVSLDLANLATVFVDSAVNGEGVSYVAVG